jgi:hypothetical protein
MENFVFLAGNAGADLMSVPPTAVHRQVANFQTMSRPKRQRRPGAQDDKVTVSGHRMAPHHRLQRGMTSAYSWPGPRAEGHAVRGRIHTTGVTDRESGQKWYSHEIADEISFLSRIEAGHVGP